MKVWILLSLSVINAHAFPTLEKVYLVKNLSQESNATEVIKFPFTPWRKADLTNNDPDNDFPKFITTGQWKEGSVIIAFLIGMYCFTFLALICDNYFLPCIERICETLDLSQDIAAATFMAMATSAPEFFVNVIGTFITESDIGVGTVMGSSLFNTLGVASLGGLAASKPIQVDWWPVTRDCTIYILSISLLVVMTWDGCIFWYEGMVLFVVYFIYFAVMFNNNKLSKLARRFVRKMSNTNDQTKVAKAAEAGETQLPPPLIYDRSNIIKKSIGAASPPVIYVINEPMQYYMETKETDKNKESIMMRRRTCGYYFLKFWTVIIWPLKFILWCTVPNPVTRPKLFPLTFIMCIIFIGTNSYVVSWMISIVGHALKIPDVVLGLTILAAGGCLPEAISIIIMSRKGNGSMGVSNALGANSMNILLSLGLPWFIKTMIHGADGESRKFIELKSESIVYTIMGLIVVVLSLFVTLLFNKFVLSRRTGITLLVFYVIFLSLATTSELFLHKAATN